MDQTLQQRFNAKWTEDPSTGCYVWHAYKNPKGYGMFEAASRQTKLAHRVAWEMVNGPIPQGMLVCHTCDNPSCVNPAHMFLGTDADNKRDSISKGRAKIPRARGEAQGHAKLTEEKVRAMRRERATDGTSYNKLAAKYGVSSVAAYHAICRVTWKHILE